MPPNTKLVPVQLSEAMRRKPVIRAARDLGISTPLEARPAKTPSTRGAKPQPTA